MNAVGARAAAAVPNGGVAQGGMEGSWGGDSLAWGHPHNDEHLCGHASKMDDEFSENSRCHLNAAAAGGQQPMDTDGATASASAFPLCSSGGSNRGDGGDDGSSAASKGALQRAETNTECTEAVAMKLNKLARTPAPKV